MSHRRVMLHAVSMLVIAFLASLTIGSMGWKAWFDSPSLLWELRGTRALLASAVGGALAVAGALLQVVFTNPLCEPYTLGISSGAALGAVLVGAFWGEALAGGLGSGALVGALVFTLPILALASKRGMGGAPLLLAGVMLGFFGSSLVALVMALKASSGVSQALVWLLGDLSRVGSLGAWSSLAVCILTTTWIYRRSAELDTLLLGEGAARSVGVDVDGLRREVILVCSVLVASAVACAGMVGFVGLMVPHWVRGRAGSLHRKVLPLCLIWGAFSVIFADAAGRALFSPREIPVGVLTALVGGPAYLYWIRKRAGRHG